MCEIFHSVSYQKQLYNYSAAQLNMILILVPHQNKNEWNIVLCLQEMYRSVNYTVFTPARIINPFLCSSDILRWSIWWYFLSLFHTILSAAWKSISFRFSSFILKYLSKQWNAMANAMTGIRTTINISRCVNFTLVPPQETVQRGSNIRQR